MSDVSPTPVTVVLDVEDVDEPVVARRLREHRLDRHLDHGGVGELTADRRRLRAARHEDERLGGVARSDRQHLVITVVGEGEVLGVLHGERGGSWLAVRGFGGGTRDSAADRGECGAERQGSWEHGRRLLASRCRAWLHRSVSWLPDRRSLPTFQPHSAVVLTPSPSRRRGSSLPGHSCGTAPDSHRRSRSVHAMLQRRFTREVAVQRPICA